MAVIIGFFGHGELSQGETGVGGVGAEGMQGLEALGLVMGAPGRLTVDGDEIVLVGPHRSDEGLKTAGEEGRIDPVHQIAQPAGARDAVMEVAESTQEGQVVLTPGHDRLEVVAAGDCGAGHQEQHLLEWIGHPPTLTIIVDLGEMLQQQRQPGRRKHRF